MFKRVFGIAAAGLVTLGVASTAFAGVYSNCSVTDVQYVKVGTTDYFVFKACSFFWYAPTSTAGSQQVQSVVTSAKLSGRPINVQCGNNGGTCASFNTNVYSANTHGTQTVWSAETVNLRDP